LTDATPVTLDQLRAFVCVVEEGSFSAAARKLKRVQSAISAAMANLETHLGVAIWDRSSRVAKLTDQGQVVLGAARRVLAEVDSLRHLTAGMVMGLEASVSLCVDAFFPLSALLEVCAAFAKQFPSIDLRVDTQVMTGVTSRVLSGAATLGVVSPVPFPPGLERKALAAVRMVPVVAAKHPFAIVKGTVPKRRLMETVQIVLSERSDAAAPDVAVLSTRTWRIGDLATKHAMLGAGLGWGNLPEHLVRDDIRRGKLVVIRPEGWVEDEHTLHLSAIYRTETILGPAHRWLLENLETRCVRDAAPVRRQASRRAPGKRR
jgi:DNA-binding transcriptional LysR family regulator